jgi:hypothetical protein
MRILSLLAGSAAAILASGVWCRPALGQWAVTTEVGADRFWGGSVENGAEHRSFRPYRPTTFGVGLERRAGRLGAGLRLRYASAGLALEGRDGVVAAKGIFTVYSAAAEVAYRIISVGSVNQLVLHGGPLFEVWKVVDEGSEIRAGVQGALSLTVPLGGRFAGAVTAGAAVIPSPFGKAQLDPSFERRALWRRRFAVGLDYRLGAR